MATGWTECAALPNRSQVAVTEALDRVGRRMPFPILGLDCDNGSEFINHNLKTYCERERITMTRCRPYKKNDQCHVEQKNWNVVRRVIGYDRYEGAQALARLTQVYAALCPFQNHFQSSLKLISKERQGARVRKVYDAAQTPCQRLLASGLLGAEAAQALSAQSERLNPAELRRRVQRERQALDGLTIRGSRTGQPPSDDHGTDTGISQIRS